MNKTKTSSEGQITISKLREKGWSFEQIGRHESIGVTRETVCRWHDGRSPTPLWATRALSRLIETETPGMIAERGRAEFCDRLDILKNRGWPMNLVAHRLGVHKTTLWRYCGEGKNTSPPPSATLDMDELLEERPPVTKQEIVHRVMTREANRYQVYEGGHKLLAALAGYKETAVVHCLRRMQRQGVVTELVGRTDLQRKRYRINILAEVQQ